MGTAFLAASTIAVGQKTENKQIDNQISNTENQLKPGEKFKLIQEEKEVAGIKLEGMIVLPTIENDTTKEYVLLKFSGEGSNLLEKERLALEKLGLKPAGSDKLDKINLEAFRAAGSNVKAINSIFEKAQDLGQTKYMLVGKDLDIVVRNPIRIQSTEVDAMNKLGTTFDYATIAYRDKNNQTQEIGPDFTKRSNTIGLPGTSIADTK